MKKQVKVDVKKAAKKERKTRRQSQNESDCIGLYFLGLKVYRTLSNGNLVLSNKTSTVNTEPKEVYRAAYLWGSRHSALRSMSIWDAIWYHLYGLKNMKNNMEECYFQ